MTFRATGCPRIEDFGGNPTAWAKEVARHIDQIGAEMESEAVARQRATETVFTVTNSVETTTLDVSTATANDVAKFGGTLTRLLQKRRIIRAAVST